MILDIFLTFIHNYIKSISLDFSLTFHACKRDSSRLATLHPIKNNHCMLETMLAIIVVQKEVDLKEYLQISWQIVKYPVITEKI